MKMAGVAALREHCLLTRNTPSLGTRLAFYKGQPTTQGASSCQRRVSRKGELVAWRREVTSGVGSSTGGATQISQFPVQSRCCFMRGSGFTSQNCQITHFLLLFCPLPLPTRSSLTLTRLLQAFSFPLFWSSNSPLQSFFRKHLCSSHAH